MTTTTNYQERTAQAADYLYRASLNHRPGADQNVYRTYHACGPEEARYVAYVEAAHLGHDYTEDQLHDGYDVHADAQRYSQERI